MEKKINKSINRNNNMTLLKTDILNRYKILQYEILDNIISRFTAYMYITQTKFKKLFFH